MRRKRVFAQNPVCKYLGNCLTVTRTWGHLPCHQVSFSWCMGTRRCIPIQSSATQRNCWYVPQPYGPQMLSRRRPGLHGHIYVTFRKQQLWRQKTEELTTKTQRRRGGMAETVPVLVSVFVRLHVFVSQRNQAGGPTLPTFKTHHRGQQHRKAGTVPHL